MVNLLITSCIQNLSEPNGWITLIIGSLISAIVPFVLYTLKAKLEILVPELNEKEACLKIKIKNNTLFKVAATNLKIEATLREPNENIDDGYFTYHLELDRENFLMLPYNDIRTFSAFKVSTSALEIGRAHV
jgi:multisubunit Na+/H+ antiporter MnhE subunit